MKASRDLAEGCGVSVGKEDSGMTPLGEQLTPYHISLGDTQHWDSMTPRPGRD
jgi:hypothetical protein